MKLYLMVPVLSAGSLSLEASDMILNNMPINSRRPLGLKITSFGVQLAPILALSILHACGDPTSTDFSEVLSPDMTRSESNAGDEMPFSSTPVPTAPPVCGDQIVEGDEECDDGNNTEGDDCDPSCLLERCGNGVVQFAERCDEGENNSDINPNSCRLNCTFPKCGDGVKDQREDCDDANQNDYDACRSTCLFALCGDGILREDLNEDDPQYEACDHGRLNSDTESNACRTNCQFARCGDGVQDAGEECDLGSQNNSTRDSGARCRLDCRIPRCGDGINDQRPECDFIPTEEPPPTCGNGRLDNGESCDQGNANTDEEVIGEDHNVGHSTCRTNCQLAQCGDGIRDLEEQCDDRNTQVEPCAYGERACEVCGSQCLLVPGEETSFCGDGHIDAREQCDPGDDLNHPTCDLSCRFKGFLCGNGQLDPNEECDDHNFEDGDGCSFECLSECGNGVIDLNEECDNGALNQTETCDLACSFGRVLIRRGMTQHQGAIPVPNYNEVGSPIYPENEEETLYHDEYVFQNDGNSTLEICFDFVTDAEEVGRIGSDDEPLLAGLFSVSLEKINSLNVDADLSLNFIESTEEIVANLSPDVNGCLALDESHLEEPGAFRLIVALKNMANITEEDKVILRERETLRRLDKEVRYQLGLNLYKHIIGGTTSHGRVGAEGNDLYVLNLDVASKVTLRITTDYFGRCPLAERLSRPRLTVYNRSLQGGLGSERAIEMQVEEEERQACSLILSSSDWSAGQYWVKVDTQSPLPSGQYLLDAYVSASNFERLPPTARQAVLSSSRYIDRLPERRATDTLDTFKALARRYFIEVPSQGEGSLEKAYQVEASTFGCESGSFTQLELWSLNDSDENILLISDGQQVDETDPQWAQGVCQRLQALLEPGRYSITVRHSSLEAISERTEDEVIGKSTLPYYVSIHHQRDLKLGGVFNGQLSIAPEDDLPIDTKPMLGFSFVEETPIDDVEKLGFITGVNRFTFSIDEREEVNLTLTPNSACELSYSGGAINVEFDLWLQLDGEDEPVRIGEATDGLEIYLIDGQLNACGGQIRLSIPRGLHTIYISVNVDNESLVLPLASDQVASSSLPQYTLILDRPQLCGNGQTEGIEQCDDGNLNTDDYCDQCLLKAMCGDGVQEDSFGESCDDGNLIPFDGCSPNCDACGDGVESTLEECDHDLDSVSCDLYCTKRLYDPQTTNYIYEGGAIAPGETDTFNLVLRPHAWLKIETFGCEGTDPTSPRLFDTKLKLTRDENNYDFGADNDQENSVCAKIEQYIRIDEGGPATLKVESERFDDILGYRLEINQLVHILSDHNGLCVKSPLTDQSKDPIAVCPNPSLSLPALKGELSGDIADQHSFLIDSRRENHLGFKVSAENQSPCPSEIYVIGFKDSNGNPVRIDFSESEDDQTTCAVFTERSWPAGQYSLHIGSDQALEYRLEAEIPAAGPESCGNGLLEIGEECDLASNGTVLGGHPNQEICRECRLPYCGDGFAERDETCDDGDQNADDQACLSNCEAALCGDGFTRTDLQTDDEGYEECDEGNQNADDQSCLSDCLSARCGDGFTRIDLVEGELGYESCDDGNTDNGDGCSADCTNREQLCSDGQFIPSDQVCPEPPLIPVCGNAFTEEDETCDDGNQINGDGCDASCQSERVYVKSGLFNQISDGVHLYEITVDGLSRLVVETEGAGSVCDNDVQDPTLPEIDTTITVYSVDDDGRLSQSIINNDDHPTRNTKCSKVDLLLYDTGRYIIEVGAYGNEPLVPYRIKLQLTRDLSRGLSTQGQLRQGETDVYAISLFDLQSINVTIDTLRAYNDLKVEVIHVDKDVESDPISQVNQPDPSTLPHLPINVLLETELNQDLFGSGEEAGDARSRLDRVFVLIHRDTEDSNVRNYAIELTRRCGDGILNYGGDARYVEHGEECDDGNTNDGDGCSSWCRTERNICGNGIVETYTKGGITILENCDSGHLLVDSEVPPDFAHPGDVSNYEMTHSVMMYFKEPSVENENSRESTFTIDTRMVHHVGIDPSLQKIDSFGITEDETNLANLAQRINHSFSGLIQAWGRGDELSMIIKGGLSSSQVVITLSSQGPWKQSVLQPLCDQSCTPLRKRLVSNARGQDNYAGYKKIEGKVEEDEEDVYLFELDGDFVLSAVTAGCRFRSDTRSGIDTSIALYRLDHGEKVSLMASSDDLEGVEGESRFCSQVNNVELSKGSYALYVSGYLNSSLENYTLYYKLTRDQIVLNPTVNNPAVIKLGPETLIYDEFSDEFDTRNHLLAISESVDNAVVKIFTQLPELCDADVAEFPLELRPVASLSYSQNQALSVELCTIAVNAQTFGNSSFTELSINFMTDNDNQLTPASQKANDLFKTIGYVPLSYQYCSDHNDCELNKCGNGIVDRGANVDDEDCDDGNNVDDDTCTNSCEINSYDIEPVIPLPALDVAGVWNTLSMGDDQVIAFKIPNDRTFKYFNRLYNTVRVSSNGFIVLNYIENFVAIPPTSRGNGCCSGGNIPLNQASSALIAPYWEDLLGQQSYRARGQNRWILEGNKLIIEWKNVEHYAYRSPLSITTQVVLDLVDHTVLLRCENCQSDGGLHTQGLRGPYPYQGIANPTRVRRNWSASSDGVRYIPTVTQ